VVPHDFSNATLRIIESVGEDITGEGLRQLDGGSNDPVAIRFGGHREA
jgi:hypothetical protein